MIASERSTACASPRVFSTRVPIAGSLARSSSIASSSSRAIASGHHPAPLREDPGKVAGQVFRAGSANGHHRARGRPGRCRCRPTGNDSRVRRYGVRAAAARRRQHRRGGRCPPPAPEHARRPAGETAPAGRSNRPAAIRAPDRRARPRRWCRTHRRDRAALCACRRAGSGRRCRASTPSNGTSGRLIVLDRSSTMTISSQASASS